MKRSIYLLLFLLTSQTIFPLKLHRVILASDLHREYIDFWPVVAQAWQNIVGIRPTLALIAPSDVQVDTTYGDVIYFDPIPDVPTHTQAQVIRLLLPALFPEEGCIISDMDMIPCSKNYFVNSILNVPDNAFVVYRDKAYGADDSHYPMCYLAARGETFSELFHIKNSDDIRSKIKEWAAQKLYWHTDEIMLYKTLNNWPEKEARLIKLGHSTFNRINRGRWGYDPSLLKQGVYIDAHLPKPYEQYIKEIDTFLSYLNIKSSYSSATNRPHIKNRHVSQENMNWFIPVLKVLHHTNGRILEMGTHEYTTPLLHELCSWQHRSLFTTDIQTPKLNSFYELTSAWHEFGVMLSPSDPTGKYPTLPICDDNFFKSRRWDLVILNHDEMARKESDVQKVRSHADVIVIPQDHEFPSQQIINSFAYRYVYDRFDEAVFIVSDTIDIKNWFEE